MTVRTKPVIASRLTQRSPASQFLNFVVVLVPAGTLSLRDLMIAVQFRISYRRLFSHCLSVPAWSGAFALIGPRAASGRTFL
jgi:hypothetical protein